MSKIKGENGIVYIWNVGTSTYQPVACLTSNGLATTVSAIESQTKCNRGVVELIGGTFTYSIPAEAENTYDANKQAHASLLALQMAKNLVNWKIDTDIDILTSPKYYGTALITDLELSQGSEDELSTFSLTLQGSGTILLTDPLD